jgi:hypothetical protein
MFLKFSNLNLIQWFGLLSLSGKNNKISNKESSGISQTVFSFGGKKHEKIIQKRNLIFTC